VTLAFFRCAIAPRIVVVLLTAATFMPGWSSVAKLVAVEPDLTM
jgi:hypothetical protein